MGLFDVVKGMRKDTTVAKSALDQANEPGSNDSAINQLIENILRIGIDGRGPYDGAKKVAEDYLAKNRNDSEAAVNAVVKNHVVTGAAGGAVTSLGGFVTMPVAIPANLLEFYVQAARMVGAVATLRGYDVSQPNIRTAILLTMVGSDADDVLAKAGIVTGTGRLATMALKNLPKPALMMVNKAIGFRLLKTVGESTLAKVGRGVPLVGGVVGGAMDGYMMNKIGGQALVEFPQGGTAQA